MVHLHSPLTSVDSRRTDAPARAPPPTYFTPLRGPITAARYILRPYIPSHGNTVARKGGIRYEIAAQSLLRMALPFEYIPAPYLHFNDTAGWRTAVPDGVCLPSSDHAVVTLFEIKKNHTAGAWWQLEKLYRPILQHIFPACRVQCVEVCEVFDPSVPFPVEVTVVQSVFEIRDLALDGGDKFVVFPWRK